VSLTNNEDFGGKRGVEQGSSDYVKLPLSNKHTIQVD